MTEAERIELELYELIGQLVRQYNFGVSAESARGRVTWRPYTGEIVSCWSPRQLIPPKSG